MSTAFTQGEAEARRAFEENHKTEMAKWKEKRYAGVTGAEQWVADRMRSIEASGIRKVFELARTIKDPINLSIGQPDFDSQEERTPYGRMFTTIAQCEACDPFSLVAKVPREQLPQITIDCGTEDPFIGHNQEFVRLLMERKMAFTYAQSPGEHRSAYWKRSIGPAMAIQYQVMRREIAEAARGPDAAGTPVR